MHFTTYVAGVSPCVYIASAWAQHLLYSFVQVPAAVHYLLLIIIICTAFRHGLYHCWDFYKYIVAEFLERPEQWRSNCNGLVVGTATMAGARAGGHLTKGMGLIRCMTFMRARRS